MITENNNNNIIPIGSFNRLPESAVYGLKDSHINIEAYRCGDQIRYNGNLYNTKYFSKKDVLDSAHKTLLPKDIKEIENWMNKIERDNKINNLLDNANS